MRELLSTLRKNQIRLKLTDGELSVKFPKGKMDKQLLETIKTRKADLVSYLSGLSEYDYLDIPLAGTENDYVLSSAQKRLWILSQLEGGNTAYNMPGLYLFEGALDRSALDYAFHTLIVRHQILRTVFRQNGQGETRQHILPAEKAGFQIAFRDLRNSAEELDSLTQEEFNTVFDLSAGPLLRAGLFQVNDNKWVFTYVMHHIISDAWSMEILMKELLVLYNAHVNEMDNPLPPLRIQYKDYAAWQQQQLAGEASAAHKKYWLQQFEGELPVLELPGDRPRPAVKTYNGAVASLVLCREITAGLKELSQQQGSTLFMGLLSGVNALLYRYTGQQDIVTGTQIAGRNHDDLEDQIGMYLNTLALRARFSGEDSFMQLLENIKQITLGAYEHQAYPFDELVDALHLQRDVSRNPLFDVSVVLQNAETGRAAEVKASAALRVSSSDSTGNPMSKFDLAFDFAERGEEIQASIVYNTDIYSAHTAQQLLRHLQQLLSALLAQPSASISRLDYLDAEEKESLLHGFNNTKVDYPSDSSIAQLFEEQAALTPEAIALVFGNKTLTYRRLDEQSNKLAHHLAEQYKLQRGSFAGVLLDRSEQLMIAILAILKTGAAYVPIDPEYPAARKEFIISDTSIQVLLTQTDYLFDLSYYSGDVFAVDVQLDTLETSIASLGVNISSNDLAYVMYTSGSTGTPKGVMVEQRSVVRLVKNTNFVSFSPSDVLLSTGAVSFDATTFEYWGMLLNGGTLVLCSRETLLDAQRLAEEIKNKGVNMMWFTAGWLNQLVEKDISVFDGLDTIVAGGDKLSPYHINTLKLAYPSVKIVNGYGPTENTTFSLTCEVPAGAERIPVGKPIHNSTAYILDALNQLVPVGVVGEICVGGDGLARGYLNNPELTEQKFIAHPFLKGERIYETGDLGRWLPDGTIEFMGRCDEQVKIRGFRIEPGEIESVLQGHEAVEAAVVLVRTREEEKELIAYIVSKQQVSMGDLRAHLAELLPAYMIPAHFVQLDQLPLNANGKVDRKALPDPDGSGTGTEYVAPRSAIEKKLVQIWQEVLGRETISVKDNFFEIGGHSLKATRLASQLHKEFEVKVELKDLFSRTILEEQAELIAQAQKTAFTAIEPVAVQDSYELSSSQRRLWILSQFKEANAAYNVPRVYVFKGALDRVAIDWAFLTLIERHESLRTIFREDGQGRGRQFILPPAESGFNISFHDLRNNTSKEEELQSLVRSAFTRAFSLSKGPLLRAGLYQVSEDEWVFTYGMHHIISDGWTMDVLFKELLQLYNSRMEGSGNPLPPLRIQYKDFAAWQQQQLSGESLDNHKNYWLQQFEGELPVLDLPTDRPRPAIKTYEGGLVSSTISREVSKGIKLLSQDHGATLYMGLLAAVNVLLYRYTGQEDMIIGTPIANREHVDLEGQIGFYANTLALRVQLDAEESYERLLSKVKEVTLGAYAHQVYPFDELVDVLDLVRDMSRNPLFDVQVILQNANTHAAANRQGLKGLSVESYEGQQNHSCVFDLVFNFFEQGDDLHLSVEYSSGLFQKETIRRMTGHLEQMMSALVRQPSEAIARIDYLPAGEKELLEQFNDSAAAYPAGNTLVSMFAESAAAAPLAEAVVFGNKKLSYRELDKQSNRLANYLRSEYNVQPDDIIGIMTERSEKFIIAIMGVLKAGAAYVPIDPSYPEARKKFIANDTGIQVLITQADYILDLEYYSGSIFAIDVQMDGLEAPAEPCAAVVRPNHLAYVIYTSGSTGQPKGVMITHEGIANTICSNRDVLGVQPGDRHLQFSSASFDASVWEIFGALASGGALYIIDESSKKEPSSLENYIRDNRIDLATLPPAYLALIDVEKIRSMKKLVTAGEAAIPEKAAAFAEQGIYFNAYGPTETSICATVFRMEGAQDSIPAIVPIGKPMANMRIHIVDRYLAPVPVGVAGEICVSGPGLARGYLNQQELTDAKFISHSLALGGRMYKTGDRGRWLPDGNIEFMGRRDEQVKIRGYRVELGEIESALAKQPGIDAAVVVARTGKNVEKELVAYVVSAMLRDMTELRASMGRILPSYMVPAYFVQLEKLPLTISGKLDKKALPDPAGSALDAGVEYVAPRNEVEEKLAAIWQEVLGREQVGVKDNFFELGGHSLKATRLAGQVHKEFDVRIELKDLFGTMILEEQAQLIGEAKKTGYVSIAPVALQDNYEISSSQRRLWILSRFEEGNIAYNLPGVYVFEGALDVEALEWSFRELIGRHEILRTVFREDAQGGVRQYVRTVEETGFCIASGDLRGSEEKLAQLVQDEFVKPFDLSSGPLLRAKLIQVSDTKWVFTYVMHHIISDGWSMGILLKELMVLYNARVEGGGNSLPALRIQYKDYAAWQQQQLSGESLLAHKNYWLQRFEGELPLLELPGDRPRPAVKTYNGATISERISGGAARELKELARGQGATLFMGLLAAVNALLHRYTGQQDIIIGTQIAGREHADLDDQIGMYLNTLALRARFNGEDSFMQLLENIKGVTLGAYEHQVYPFDELVDALNLQRYVSRNPLFDVSVVLQNAEAASLADVKSSGALTVSGDDSVDNRMSKFDLAFDFAEIGEEIQASIVYNTDIYSAHTAQQLLRHLQQLLSALLAQPFTSISRLDYLRAEEKESLLHGFNNTKVDYPSDSSIARLFEEQAIRTPEAIALVFGNKEITYRQLDEQSNKLAHHLSEQYKLQPGSFAGVLLDRSEQLMMAILAILKTGAAYVPIDPEYPTARKQFIISDTSIQVLITQTDYLFDLSYYSGDVFAVDVQLDTLETSNASLYININSSDLAYVMYTSGSTGTPKGVMVEQRGVIRLVKNTNYVNLKEEKAVLSGGALGFDATTFEYWSMLLNGGKLVMTPREVLLDSRLLAQELRRHKADIMFFTTGWVNQLIDEQIDVFTGLKTVLTGGEKISIPHIQKLQNRYPQLNIVHCYGPTENTTFSLTYPIGVITYSVPIGKVINNSTVYILDTLGQLVPPGVAGEICVGGDGLARGYLNNPELTEQKFIAHPFITGERIYKTGDLGKWTPDGNIEFIGRRDEQVKIRGFRIEPGEIAAALQSYEGVETAIVIARGNAGQKELVAYFTGCGLVSISDLRAHLAGLLPAYMVPAHFVQLDQLPLNANGKVDRKALPDPDGSETGVEYIAPRNAVEEKLVRIWQEVLGREKVSVKDNFFEIGGHSLKATRLGSQLHKEFEVKLELKDLFTNMILEEQAELIAQAQKSSFVSIEPVSEQPDYLLSSSQRRLWVLSQFEEANVAYNIPGAYVFKGTLDREALDHAFHSLIERHEILRTTFREDAQGGVRQVVRTVEGSGFRTAFHDLGSDEYAEERLNILVQENFTAPFDLVQGPLLRAALYRLNDSHWVLSYVMHHIISDGWSMDILISELLQFYNAYAAGETNPLSPLRIQYKDYAAWQQQQLSGESLDNHKNYWLQQFEGELPVLELPADRARPAVKTYAGGLAGITMGKDTASALKAFSQGQGSTLFMGLLAAVNALLYRYTGQEDIIVGSPIAGRRHADLEDQIGFYVNTLALRVQFNEADSFRQLLAKVKEVTLGAYEHQVYPFDELVDGLSLQRDMSRNPLFDVSVVLQNAGAATAAEGESLDGLEASNYAGGESRISKFDLLFGFTEQGGDLHLSLEYNSDIYDTNMAERIGRHLRQLLRAIVAQPSASIAELDYLDETEKQKLVSEFNNHTAAYPQHATITSLFEEQAALTPDNIAVAFEEKELSYKELNEKANRLAHYIRSNYIIHPDDLIAVQLERSEKMIVALLAVLKSGGAYVPIDPGYPQERIDYMISDSGCKLVIDEELLKKFYKEEGQYGVENPSTGHLSPSSLAYVIYTSGTTGKPKGSLIEHRNVVRLFKTDKPLFDFSEKDVWTVFHSFCFDFSVWEMYGALLFGGKTVIVPKAVAQDTSAYRQLLLQHGVTVLNQTPSAFYNLIREELEHEASDLQLRYVIFGGEALSPGRLKEWKEKYPATKLVNMYGITETTVHVTYKEITQKEIEENSSNIGRPIPTLSCYVLDARRQLVPAGVWGELYVGGEGVCRGYLNREELTAQKFIQSPFKTGERLYRSGDRVRLLENGELEYGGRIDDQVKIRGYRMELGEIESVLQSHPDVESAIVIARSGKDGEKELAAYVVSGGSLNTAGLRSHMGAMLPAYMIPAYFVQLGQLPLTSNGKVNRKALPDPEGSTMNSGTEYVAPRTEVEQILVAIYEDVLKRQPIGIKENFFVLGGDSIKSIQIVSRIKQKGYMLTIRDILTYPVIEDLARHVKAVARMVDQEAVEGLIPLSPIQHYFFGISAGTEAHFNQSVLLKSRERISEEALSMVLEKIVLHHDALRMVYRKTNSGWVQENRGREQRCSLQVIEESSPEAIAAHCDRIQSSINLEDGPLFKVALFRSIDGDQLLLVAHHLVIDGVSWRILFEDLSNLYRQYLLGQSLVLPLKTDSFRYWQEKQVEYATAKTLQKEQRYWNTVEARGSSPLPLDNPEASNLVKDAASTSCRFDEELTRKLLTECYKAYQTEINDVLLTALSLALTEVFGMDKVLVQLEGHGREHIGADTDVTRTIGWFTTLYPVQFDMRHRNDMIRQLVEVKECLHRVPNKGIGYGVLRYLAGKDYKAAPAISFNYLGDFGSGVKADDGSSLFEYCGDYRGEEVSACRTRDVALDVSGMVTGGSLSLSITYSKEQYREETMEKLMNAFRLQLQNLVDRLSTEKETHLSPVDFTYKGLSVEQLQKLNQIA